MLAAEQFNQGYATTEYLAAAVTDQAIHQLATDQIPDVEQLLHFESDALDQAGAGVELIPPRYRFGYYSHILGGYTAGYYAYIWSEVLDADTVEWFKENGGMTRANGQHFRATVLSRGGSAEAMSLFQDFAGREARLAPCSSGAAWTRHRRQLVALLLGGAAHDLIQLAVQLVGAFLQLTHLAGGKSVVDEYRQTNRPSAIRHHIAISK